jgi:DNA recombination protein RmuC
MEFLFLAAGIAIGALIMWLLMRGKTQTAATDPRTAELDRQNAGLQAQLSTLNEERKRSEEHQKAQREKLEADLEMERAKVGVLTDQLGRKETELRGAEQRLQEQKAELEKLQQQFAKEFENLANRIFDEKSKKFTEQNRSQLDDLLKPFGEKIKDFEKKVNDVYVNETKERASLKEQIVQLHQLNQQMSKDAQNLTRALKGEAKTQGNWGEFILESVLEKSGLQKDREYRTQASYTSDEGSRYQPDVIIDLPDEKHLVVDSKVSLVAYERFISAETDEEKAAALKEHVLSVRKHIRDLGEKKYQDIYQLNSLDFVLLFMPVEPAFALSVQADPELFNDAFSKNIVIVSPTTLLATLRTVANIWRQEFQNRNVMRIAEEAAAMYDKFAGFTEAMIKMGKKMDESKSEYEDAMKRLSTGPGNVIKRIENLKKLGLKVNKEIHPKLVERAEDYSEEKDGNGQ